MAQGSCLRAGDCISVFSVGGGNLEKCECQPGRALVYAKSIKAKILGVVGRDGGYTGSRCMLFDTCGKSCDHNSSYEAFQC